MTLSARARRKKGISGEQMVCRILRRIPEVEAERELDQYQHTLGRDIKTNLPLCIQVKTAKAPNIRAALAEAKPAADCFNYLPAAVTKANRGKYLITMELEEFVENILREWWELSRD